MSASDTPRTNELRLRYMDADFDAGELAALYEHGDTLERDCATLRAVAESFLSAFADFERWPQGKGYSMSDEALAVYVQARAALAKVHP